MKRGKKQGKGAPRFPISHRRMRGGDRPLGGKPCATGHAGLAALALAIALSSCAIAQAAAPAETLARPSPGSVGQGVQEASPHLRIGPLLACDVF